MTLKVKNKQLAKFREFRKGMDVEDFLQDEFKQVLRALQNQYVEGKSYVESGSSGILSPLSSLYYSELTVNIKTTGGRVRVGLVCDGSDQSKTTGSVLGAFNSGGSSAEAHFVIKRDDVVICTLPLRIVGAGTSCRIEVPCSSLSMIDNNLEAGDHTYIAGINFITGLGYIRSAKLYAEELF